MAHSAMLANIIGAWAGKPEGPPPPPAAHKYWMLTFQATHSIPPTNVVSIVEIELRGTAGVAIDMAASGAATANGSYPGGFTPDKAIDKSAATGWICPDGTVSSLTAWWKFTFTTAQLVSELLLQAFNTPAGAQQMPKDFTLLWSDDNVSWTSTKVVTGTAPFTSSEIRLYPVP